MRKLLRREEGVALVVALALIVLSLPLVTAALGLASTLSLDSRTKIRILKRLYSSLGGNEHALYRVIYEEGYTESLTIGVPDTYTIDLNDEPVEVTVVKQSDPPVYGPSPADNSRRLQVLKTVTPTTADPNTSTTYTYTITVENRDDESEGLTKIHDILPTGFSYVAGSTSGVTTSDPSISGQQLTWNIAGLNLTLQPGDKVTLTFQAQASVGTGNYCNETWAEPGQRKTSSGKTAMVKVGTPSNDLCPGAAVSVTLDGDSNVDDLPPGFDNAAPGNTLVTYTYTITIKNTGTSVLSMSKARDLLPPSFSYVAGSTSGNVTTSDPTTTSFQGRQRLDWDFYPAKRILPGQTKTITFDAQAQVAPGDYWSDVWITFAEFADTIYTWPSGVIKVMGIVKSVSTEGDTTTASEIWIGTDSFFVK